MHSFLVVKFVFFAINQHFALKRLSAIEILVICVRKKFLYPLPPPGVGRENKTVCRSQEFFSTPPPPWTTYWSMEVCYATLPLHMIRMGFSIMYIFVFVFVCIPWCNAMLPHLPC